MALQLHSAETGGNTIKEMEKMCHRPTTSGTLCSGKGKVLRPVALKLSLHCEDVVPATARGEIPRALGSCTNDVWTEEEVGYPIFIIRHGKGEVE